MLDTNGDLMPDTSVTFSCDNNAAFSPNTGAYTCSQCKPQTRMLEKWRRRTCIRTRDRSLGFNTRSEHCFCNFLVHRFAGFARFS